MQIVDINGKTREVEKVYPDPDYPGYVRVQFKRYHEWYTFAEFVEFNPDLKEVVKGFVPPPIDIVGNVTQVGKDYLIDSTLDLKPQAYLGMEVWISRGKGEGQQRLIVKNTKTKITIDKPWEVRPDKTSQFVISQTIMDVPAMGNTLPQEDMRALEKKALKIDRERGVLTPDYLKQHYRHLKPEDLK